MEVRRPTRRVRFRVQGIDGERVTSTYRTPAHNKAVGGVPNSFHTRRDRSGNPLARDSVPPSGMSMSDYYRIMRQRNPGLDIINEGDHIHAEPSPWSAENLARYGHIRR